MDKIRMTKLVFDCCEEIINVSVNPQIDRLEKEIEMIKKEIMKLKGKD